MQFPDLAGWMPRRGRAGDGGRREAEHELELTEPPAQVNEGLRGEGPDRSRIAGSSAPPRLLWGHDEAGVVRDSAVEVLADVSIPCP